MLYPAELRARALESSVPRSSSPSSTAPARSRSTPAPGASNRAAAPPRPRPHSDIGLASRFPRSSRRPRRRRGRPRSPMPRGRPRSPAPRGRPRSPAPRERPRSPVPRGRPRSPAPRGRPTILPLVPPRRLRSHSVVDRGTTNAVYVISSSFRSPHRTSFTAVRVSKAPEMTNLLTPAAAVARRRAGRVPQPRCSRDPRFRRILRRCSPPTDSFRSVPPSWMYRWIGFLPRRAAPEPGRSPWPAISSPSSSRPGSGRSAPSSR